MSSNKPPRKGSFWNLNRTHGRADLRERRHAAYRIRCTEEFFAQQEARMLQKLSRGTGEVSDEVRRDVALGLYYEKTEPEGGFPWGLLSVFCAVGGFLAGILLNWAGVL